MCLQTVDTDVWKEVHQCVEENSSSVAQRNSKIFQHCRWVFLSRINRASIENVKHTIITFVRVAQYLEGEFLKRNVNKSSLQNSCLLCFKNGSLQRLEHRSTTHGFEPGLPYKNKLNDNSKLSISKSYEHGSRLFNICTLQLVWNHAAGRGPWQNPKTDGSSGQYMSLGVASVVILA